MQQKGQHLVEYERDENLIPLLPPASQGTVDGPFYCIRFQFPDGPKLGIELNHLEVTSALEEGIGELQIHYFLLWRNNSLF